MKFEFVNSISEISSKEFSALTKTNYPFLSYEFLCALEKSKSVCADTGWQVEHLTIRDNKEFVGFVPLYLKSHSYGEYVFDFQWANAYHQSGLQYYPKLVTAIPFTPCSGTRILLKDQNNHSIKVLTFEKIIMKAKSLNVSSFHYLFPIANDNSYLGFQNNEVDLMQRVGMQYHWFNKDYKNFDDFLNQCKVKQRKNIKRERKSFIDSSISIKTIEGGQIEEYLWRQFYLLYCSTYAKRSGNYGYLNETFFQLIGKTMADKIMMTVAYVESVPIAISLFFKDKETLYGRYWGCSQEIEFLHFELCYYQGIEYCIKNKIQKFDAGAQGEHKIPRGFKPIKTYSYHWIDNPDFKAAIGNFLEREAPLVEDTMEQLSKRLPYK
ncbi:MAG: GNAT family N-acetyltransferase [Kangiellaceae bacterium]